MKKISEKYNESCIKIFDMLKLLSKGTARYNDIIELFENEEVANSGSAAHVILNKYLNTLKIFGINVYKQKNIYYLQNSFFSINLSKNEIRILKKFKEAGLQLTNLKQKAQFLNLINEIEIRLTSSSREILNQENKNIENSINEYFENHKNIIEECEKYCFENPKLEIKFCVGSKIHKVICSPKEINYSNGKAYLSVFNHINRQNFEISIDSIIDMKEMPTITKNLGIPMTIVFQIKDGLAKAYQLKEWETSDGIIDSDGWLTIINHDENVDELIQRLMRYNLNCRVVSPKNVKERMIAAIDNTLANYL